MSWGVFTLLIGMVACGGSSDKNREGDSEEKETPQPAPVNPKQSESGQLTVRVRPFLGGQNSPRLAWVVPPGRSVSEVLDLQTSLTIPGYHWEWESEKNLGIWKWSGDSAAEVSELRNRWQALNSSGWESQDWSGATAIGFGIDFQKPALSQRWPAVVGGGGADSFALNVFALSPVRPKNYALPLRLEFDLEEDIDTKAFFMLSQAKRCGDFCLEFENYAAALDSPVAFTRAQGQVFNRQSGKLRFFAFDQDRSPLRSVEECTSPWQKVLETGQGMFNKLAERWGTPVGVTQHFDVLLINGQSGPRYQGLEHSQNTLLKMSGDCSSTSYQNQLAALLSHEIVHVWNVRHLQPREHGTFNGGGFDSQRLKQLYLYEGWTEGFSRVVLSEQDVRWDSRSAWNNSLAALYSEFDQLSAGEALTLNQVDSADAFRQYQTGAGFLLFLALKLRAAETERVAHTRFWSLLTELASLADAGATAGGSFQVLPWKRWAWTGVLGQTGAGFGKGFTSEQVVQVIQKVVGTVNGTSQGTVALTRTELEDTLRAFSNATGVSLETRSSGRLHFASSASQRSWPLGPLSP